MGTARSRRQPRAPGSGRPAFALARSRRRPAAPLPQRARPGGRSRRRPRLRPAPHAQGIQEAGRAARGAGRPVRISQAAASRCASAPGATLGRGAPGGALGSRLGASSTPGTPLGSAAPPVASAPARGGKDARQAVAGPARGRGARATPSAGARGGPRVDSQGAAAQPPDPRRLPCPRSRPWARTAGTPCSRARRRCTPSTPS